MVKVTRILSAVCAGISGLSFISFFVVLFNQKRMIDFFGNISAEGMFFFPVSIFIKFFAVLLAGVLLWAVAGRRIGYWAEIAIAVFISCVIPPVEWLVSNVQSILMGKYGAQVLAAYAALVKGYSMYSVMASFAMALIFVVCGLSIATKVYERRLSRPASSADYTQFG